VRLLLEEKKIPWESHHIFLAKRENITEEYFGINPKGVVPSLVHDGKIITESNDILIYLEDTFPDPSFCNVSSKKKIGNRTLAKNLGRSPYARYKNLPVFQKKCQSDEKKQKRKLPFTEGSKKTLPI
jgi:glutathione S-transferase